jgi:hypothetical protein
MTRSVSAEALSTLRSTINKDEAIVGDRTHDTARHRG